MNRRIVLLSSIGLFLHISLSPAFGLVNQGRSARIEGGAMVNIRSRPSMDGAVITSLAKGSEVYSVTNSYSSGWKKIEVPTGAHLWVSRSYIDAASTVTASNLHVRTGPGSYHDSLGLIPHGTEVEILGSVRNWYMVAAPRGLTAYVASYFVREDQSQSRPPESQSSSSQASGMKLTEIETKTLKVKRNLSPGEVLNSQQILSDLWSAGQEKPNGAKPAPIKVDTAAQDSSEDGSEATEKKGRWRWLNRILRRE